MKSKKIFSKVLSVILCLLIMTSIIPAGVIGAVAENDSDTLLEVGAKAYSGWVAGTKDEYTVATNKTSGDITIVFTPARNNWQTEGNNLLSINGVSLIKAYGVNGSYKGYYLGTTAVKTDKANVITVVINPTSGAATISDTAGNSGTANVGAIKDSFKMTVNQEYNNSWEITSIVVTQEKATSGDSADTSTLISIGEKSYAGWSAGTADTHTVATNKTSGDITIVFTPARNNWQTEGNNLLSINGVSLIKAYGVNGSYKGYYLGTTAVKTDKANVITVVINPTSGAATISDTAGNSGTANVGAIKDSFKITVNQEYNNSWELTSIVVTQEVGGELETHTCEYTTTVKEATCTTPEFTTKTCGECGASIDTVTSPVLGHTWGAWSKVDGVSTRSCSVCGESQSKSVSAIDTSKSLLAIGDSLAYGTNLDNAVNGSWAKKVADSLGMSSYSNLAVPGSEVYQWYSLITGNNAPNDKYELGKISWTKEELTQAIENAGAVAISLGSNDMSKGYLEHRTAQKIHDSLKNIVDEIHTINPDAVVVLVGYAHGVVSRLNEYYKGSDQHFIDFNSSMTATFNSDAYNDFAYYVDVSDTMSDESLISEDRAHPIADGHQKIANSVISALGSIIDDEAGNKDLVTWEGIPSYVNHFDGTAPAAAVVAWGEKGSNGVLTVEPLVDPHANKINVGSVAFPGKTIVTFKFNIPELPESGTINIFHDRSAFQSYICVFSGVNEETQETEFWASVGNNNAGNSVVKIEENTWYDVTILFAEDASSYSRVYVNNTFVGTVKGSIIGTKARNGFANFSGCSGAGDQNAATYQIDDFTASTVADNALVHAYGIQRTEPVGELYDVRFVLSVDEIYAGEEAIGIDVTVNYSDNTSTKTGVETRTVFEQISECYGENTISAEELGGKYIAAIVVEDIPATYDSVEFIVSPYAVVNGVKYYSDTMTATIYLEK